MAVYRFVVKGNGVCGVVKYTAGMNVEVADTQARKGDNPFNTRTKKIFVQEFASKYDIKQDFSTISAIEAMFKRDRLDAQEISANTEQPKRSNNSSGNRGRSNSGDNRGRVVSTTTDCERCGKSVTFKEDIPDTSDVFVYCSEKCETADSKNRDNISGKKRIFIAKSGLFSRAYNFLEFKK